MKVNSSYLNKTIFIRSAFGFTKIYSNKIFRKLDLFNTTFSSNKIIRTKSFFIKKKISKEIKKYFAYEFHKSEKIKWFFNLKRKKRKNYFQSIIYTTKRRKSMPSSLVNAMIHPYIFSVNKPQTGKNEFFGGNEFFVITPFKKNTVWQLYQERIFIDILGSLQDQHKKDWANEFLKLLISNPNENYPWNHNYFIGQNKNYTEIKFFTKLVLSPESPRKENLAFNVNKHNQKLLNISDVLRLAQRIQKCFDKTNKALSPLTEEIIDYVDLEWVTKLFKKIKKNTIKIYKHAFSSKISTDWSDLQRKHLFDSIFFKYREYNINKKQKINWTNAKIKQNKAKLREQWKNFWGKRKTFFKQLIIRAKREPKNDKISSRTLNSVLDRKFNVRATLYNNFVQHRTNKIKCRNQLWHKNLINRTKNYYFDAIFPYLPFYSEFDLFVRSKLEKNIINQSNKYKNSSNAKKRIINSSIKTIIVERFQKESIYPISENKIAQMNKNFSYTTRYPSNQKIFIYKKSNFKIPVSFISNNSINELKPLFRKTISFFSKWIKVILKQKRARQSSFFFLTKNVTIYKNFRIQKIKHNILWHRNKKGLNKYKQNLLLINPSSFFFFSQKWLKADKFDYNFWGRGKGRNVSDQKNEHKNNVKTIYKYLTNKKKKQKSKKLKNNTRVKAIKNFIEEENNFDYRIWQEAENIVIASEKRSLSTNRYFKKFNRQNRKFTIPKAEKSSFWSLYGVHQFVSVIECVIWKYIKKKSIFKHKKFSNVIQKNTFSWWEKKVKFNENAKKNFKDHFIFPFMSHGHFEFKTRQFTIEYPKKKNDRFQIFYIFKKAKLINLNKEKKKDSLWGTMINNFFKSYATVPSHSYQKAQVLAFITSGFTFKNKINFFKPVSLNQKKIEKKYYIASTLYNNISNFTQYAINNYFFNSITWRWNNKLLNKWWTWQIQEHNFQKNLYQFTNKNVINQWNFNSAIADPFVTKSAFYGKAQLFFQRERILESYMNAEASAPHEQIIPFSFTMNPTFAGINLSLLEKEKEWKFNTDDKVTLFQEKTESAQENKFPNSEEKQKNYFFNDWKSVEKEDSEQLIINSTAEEYKYNSHLSSKMVSEIHKRIIELELTNANDSVEPITINDYSEQADSSEEQISDSDSDFPYAYDDELNPEIDSEDKKLETSDEEDENFRETSKTRKWTVVPKEWFPIPRYIKNITQKWVPKHYGTDPGFRKTIDVDPIIDLDCAYPFNNLDIPFQFFNIQSYRRRRIHWYNLKSRSFFKEKIEKNWKIKRFYKRNFIKKKIKDPYFFRSQLKHNFFFYNFTKINKFEKWLRWLKLWKWSEQRRKKTIESWIWLRKGIKKSFKTIVFNQEFGTLQFVKQEEIKRIFKEPIRARGKKKKHNVRLKQRILRWYFINDTFKKQLSRG